MAVGKEVEKDVTLTVAQYVFFKRKTGKMKSNLRKRADSFRDVDGEIRLGFADADVVIRYTVDREDKKLTSAVVVINGRETVIDSKFISEKKTSIFRRPRP